MENHGAKEEEKFIVRAQDEIDVRIGANRTIENEKENKPKLEKKKSLASFWKRKKVIKIFIETSYLA